MNIINLLTFIHVHARPLEEQLQSNLSLPHISGERGDRAEGGVAHLRIGLRVVRMIRKIEKLAANLQIVSLSETEVFKERHVQAAEAGAADRVAAGVAVAERICGR